ncbi:chromosome segregation protein SMC [Litorimonas sp. RW-G-Af-16]|uniref:chromosome segregation protein SMC n=1 Tax=Litorimonas sp. RW-G-Af-16 TaxID=3241168 RepID=UPI00390C5981
MAFNSITLAGFKSFVEPTEFLIESGLTGIVGPNGCGKSNLLEAIRWVMGANSAKAMRGAAMDDVIFNGTKTRPGRNQAHVMLSVDNSARIAPPAFNDADTLEVMRVITKGGGSKYKINGQTVRAKDVQLLFADASTGANSPALVRQGQISELIAAKPSNRRRILEEAAGISGLHTRRHEAELRLRAAENNLDRLDDIIGQIESQLLSLRRQSRQATRYKRLAGEINEYKALLWLKRWQAALDTLAGAQDALKACEAQVADTATKASELTRKASELAGLLDPKREEQLIAAALLARLNAAKEALEADENAANTEIKKLERQIDQLAADLERESGIVMDSEEAQARLSEEFAALSAVKDTSAALDAAADAAAEALQTRNALDEDYNALNRQAAAQTARTDANAREVSQFEQRLFRLKNEREEATSRLDGLNKDSGAGANLFAAGAKDALTALEAARAQEQTLSAKRAEAEDVDQAARDALSDVRQSLGKLSAEKTAIERILSRGDQADWTPALDSVKAKPGYEQALAAVLGEDLDAAIGTDAAMVWSGAEMPQQNLPNGVTPLADKVTAPAELSACLSQIGVVETGDIAALAKQLSPGQSLVTKDGQVARWDGFNMAAGVETSAAMKLKQQNRLTELTAEIKEFDARLATATQAFEATRIKRDAAITAAKEARSALPDLERRDRAAQAALAQYETDIARESAEKRSLEDRIARLSKEIAELEEQLSTAQATRDELAKQDDVSAELDALSEKLSQARDAADEASAQYRSLKNDAEARAARLKAVETERADWAKRAATATERVNALEARSAAATMSLKAATEGPDQFAERRDRLFADLAAAEARRTSAADALSQAETEASEAQYAAREAESAHGEAREARAGAEARLNAAQERIAETKARINETLSCEPSELKAHLGELDADSGLSEHDIERKLERLSHEREKMGGVNLRADEEAVEQEERLTAMNDERQDLIAAIARLREGIDELNTEGRERLLKAFDMVNGHFGRLFVTLFGGGEAALALTESDDPLEAGLEVMARPPGKSLKAMSLLSGGEQALTATALIFAVFLSNPAPVCVLDEVDAPLDDANVSRYCDLLEEMKKQTNTKFIAITHNPVTMSRMDRLFGVTMAEQGVSQLLSIELGQAEKLVAAE